MIMQSNHQVASPVRPDSHERVTVHAQVQRAVLGCADLLAQRITAKLKYCDALETSLSRERDSLQASFAAVGSCAQSTASFTAQVCVTCSLTWHGRASRATVLCQGPECPLKDRTCMADFGARLQAHRDQLFADRIQLQRSRVQGGVAATAPSVAP